VPESLDEYRSEADRFLAELEEEHYRHLAGLKDRLEIEPIYEAHAGLASLDACRWLEAEATDKPPGSASVELWRFGCEGYLGRLAREQAERIAALEASLTATFDGEEIAYRMLRPGLANEPDQARRESLDRARLELVERTNPLRIEAHERLEEGARELGARSMRDLYERFGLPLATLGEQCASFLADTEELYVSAFDRLLRTRIGMGLESARRWDVARALRAPGWDGEYPADRMLPALEGTLGDLGIELRRQANIHLDVEDRETKDPRAFCAPIEVPGRVMLVIKPIGGLEDWLALFHEAGHAEHFAHVSPRLHFEARRLGDNAVTEGWAFLVEHLVTDPAWLTRRLDAARPHDVAAESSAVLLYYVRRYCAKLLYELGLQSGADLGEMPDRYVELLGDATKVPYAPADYLADVDSGFYCTSYLRAWALEAHLVAFLREHHGRAWFADRAAGSLLRELWNEGQGMDADTIAREVTGQPLEFGSIGERIAESI
jgi:hypothetical protein